jgi:SAM-dependent methyltransferase
MPEARAARLGGLIEGLVRAQRTTAPPPRALPYFGLEHPSGTTALLLDGLAARGIFRKYELVLDLGAGLGATSRWLAMRLGCEVVGATSDAAEAAAGAELTRRAGVASQVRFVPAEPGALPFGTGRFTHVWIVETLARVPDVGGALAEAWRALRRGGTLAVQELALGAHAPSPIAGWHPVPLEDRVRALGAAGFVEIDVRDRSDEAVERDARVLGARTRLLARLRADPALVPLAVEREALAEALARGTLRVVQMLARRP